MIFEIKPAKNGLIVSCDSDDEPMVFRELENELDEVDAWASFLWELTQEFGPQANLSRYSAKRVYIEVRPGDKYESTQCLNGEKG